MSSTTINFNDFLSQIEETCKNKDLFPLLNDDEEEPKDDDTQKKEEDTTNIISPDTREGWVKLVKKAHEELKEEPKKEEITESLQELRDIITGQNMLLEKRNKEIKELNSRIKTLLNDKLKSTTEQNKVKAEMLISGGHKKPDFTTPTWNNTHSEEPVISALLQVSPVKKLKILSSEEYGNIVAESKSVYKNGYDKKPELPKSPPKLVRQNACFLDLDEKRAERTEEEQVKTTSNPRQVKRPKKKQSPALETISEEIEVSLENINSLNKNQLIKICQGKNLKGYSRCKTKPALVQFIIENLL
jgi:hypothetical protein